MAWLIALALFWWIGSALTKGYDRRLYNATKKRLDMQNYVSHFLSHMYVAAWYYYQSLERQVAERWIAEHSNYTINDFAPTCQQYRVFGSELLQCDIQEVAIGQAFGYLRNHGIGVCSRDFNYPSGDHTKGWTTSSLPYQQQHRENCTDIAKELPVLWAAYRWDVARAVSDSDVKTLIPSPEDPMTESYWRPHYNGQTWELRLEPREPS